MVPFVIVGNSCKTAESAPALCQGRQCCLQVRAAAHCTLSRGKWCLQVRAAHYTLSEMDSVVCRSGLPLIARCQGGQCCLQVRAAARCTLSGGAVLSAGQGCRSLHAVRGEVLSAGRGRRPLRRFIDKCVS